MSLRIATFPRTATPATAPRPPGGEGGEIGAGSGARDRIVSGPRAEEPEIGPSDSGALMGRVRNGEIAAFDEIVERYWEKILFFAQHLTRDRDAAYDITQEVFGRLWQKREDWVGSGSVVVWLMRTARNIAVSEQRKWNVRARRALQIAQEYPAVRTPLEDTEKLELRSAIDRAIWKLSPRRREVFTLFHLQGLSYRETAAILGIRPQSVANHLGAAVAELRILLAPYHASIVGGDADDPEGTGGSNG